MSIIDGRSVVLVTFGGRRDRMELLARYVREAMNRQLVDEWHVWSLPRDDLDGDWLHSRFPHPGRTADDLEYRAAGGIDPTAGQWGARVRAGHDVHLGLRARQEHAPSLEIVIGGWENQRTQLRQVDTAELLVRDDGDRAHPHEVLTEVFTPGVLSANTFRDVGLSLDPSGLTLTIDGATMFRCDVDLATDGYDVHVKTGYGADGEWRFTGLPDTKEYLYHSTERWRAGFAEALHFYADRADHHADTVFLKCDDDIVYLQLDKLEDFLRFRLAHPEYFLVSANVINNNVCAHHQQQHGAIPPSLMELELPPGGFGGMLWESATLAAELHHHFIDNRQLFEQVPPTPIEWSGRLATHFVSWLGRDLSYMSANMVDDEHALSVQIPTYLQRRHCIHPGFLVAHLSSGKQASALHHHPILRRYWQLALENKLATDDEVRAHENSGSPDDQPAPTPSGGGNPCGRIDPSTLRPVPPRQSDDEPNIAIIVLNFNTAEMTNQLAGYLNHRLAYGRKWVYVIDNGSDEPPLSATDELPRNLGFAHGMYAGYRIASARDDYDAFWLLNSDVSFDYGNAVLRNLVDVLFSSDDYAQIAPQHNSTHQFMERVDEVAAVQPLLEPTATLIKRSTIDRLGFWDLDMVMGYGTDHDYGYRIRRAGLQSIVTNRARIHHAQHQSMDDFDEYQGHALAEEDLVLGQKYGADWRRVLDEY
ncbi:hypothetical protein K7711_20650 [Nocardia sp. CA2R105]|uniref:hypothetical protein n=1 Tax=Nocardia coffeae TaxID=2873381 RepID=UPI001CA77C68|nr:hypothetical protein [Nocardia coffeae]MBY8858895.1 hypothetical protein [Nocardia coffeae]